ncbi:MAG: ankyrin repeat domain-containing protein, partial [Candidatus Ozemobacteraceae bacterium]
VPCDEKNQNGETPLVKALWHKKFDVAELLLKSGANIDVQMQHVGTPLMMAAKDGSLDIVKFLVDHKAKTDVKNEAGETASVLADKSGNIAVAEFFEGLSGNWTRGQGENRDPVVLGKKLLEVLNTGRQVTARELIEKGADITLKDEQDRIPLMIVLAKKYETCVGPLLSRTTDFSCLDKRGNTILHYAAPYRDKAVLKAIWKKMGNPQQKNDAGETPLFWSVEGESIDNTDFLLLKGADLNARNASGETPVFIAVRDLNQRMVDFLFWQGSSLEIENMAGETPVFSAVRRTDMEMVNNLVGKGVNLSRSNRKGEGVLFCAVNSLQDRMTDFLLSKGANPNEPGPDGGTILHYCCAQFRDSTVTSLLKAGAKTDSRDKNGKTPLDLALEKKNRKSCQALLDAGVSVTAPNGLGEPPIFAASRGKDQELIRLLLKKGASLDVKNPQGATPFSVVLDTPQTVTFLVNLGVGNDLVIDEKMVSPKLGYLLMDDPREFRQLLQKPNGKTLLEKVLPKNLLATASAQYAQHFINLNASETLVFFLSHGLKPNLQDCYGESLLSMAIKSSAIDCAKELVKAGADINSCTSYTKDGANSLILAIVNNQKEFAKWLIERGVKTDVRW